MNQKKLSKSDDKILLGVCAGIADFLGWPKTTVRLLWIIFTFMGLGIFAYPILALLMPNASDKSDHFEIEDYREE
ncbi:PspC domain-containing protein [Maribacter arcticus]|uniref:PspC domain-containing protein n=1 Tax=Maribacter arcticus TaxID=561365 RepID=UPI0030DDDEAF|tara:strand:- start:595 stop:819 length:225 start_codon:yes stop_codon:yes gene_type:complete